MSGSTGKSSTSAPPEMPETPPRQKLQSMEEYFTPEANLKLNTLIRKTSEMSLGETPKAPGPFMRWRIACIRSQVDVLRCARESLKEAFQNGRLSKAAYISYRSDNFDEQDKLEEEERELLSQGRFMEQDLADSVKDAETAYVNDIYYAFRIASSEGQKKRHKILSQNKFSNQVIEYFGAETGVNDAVERWCSVLGLWIVKEKTRCAHIVPKSFDSRELGYLFGAGDAALESVRNGIVMYQTIEGAFDNGWVTIVPDGSVERTPTQWKMVLLNQAVKNDTVYTEKDRHGVYKTWRWTDVHNRKLTWQNDNRPARRYLYFRHIMALMTAEDEKWNGYREMVPPGQVWATPNKPSGYLRGSVLRSLARRVNNEDILPEALVEAGTFEDTEPPTGTETNGKTAEIAAGVEVTKLCTGRAKRAKEEESEDSNASDEG